MSTAAPAVVRDHRYFDSDLMSSHQDMISDFFASGIRSGKDQVVKVTLRSIAYQVSARHISECKL